MLLQGMLIKFDSRVRDHNGIFGMSDSSSSGHPCANVPAGQAACSEIMNSAFEIAHLLTESLEASMTAAAPSMATTADIDLMCREVMEPQAVTTSLTVNEPPLVDPVTSVSLQASPTSYASPLTIEESISTMPAVYVAAPVPVTVTTTHLTPAVYVAAPPMTTKNLASSAQAMCNEIAASAYDVVQTLAGSTKVPISSLEVGPDGTKTRPESSAQTLAGATRASCKEA